MSYFRKIVLIVTIAIAAFPLWAMQDQPREIYSIIFYYLLEYSKEPNAKDLTKLGQLLPVSKKMYSHCDSFGLEQVKKYLAIV